MKRFFSFLLSFITLLPYATRANVIYVDATATGSGNGSSWTNAYLTLSAALAASNGGATSDSIFIAAGTYYPTGIQASTMRDSAFCITRGGIRLYGGYPAGGGARNPALHQVSLDGNIGAVGNITDNSRHVLIIAGLSVTADTVLLDGLTIQNGYADGGNTIQYVNGKPLTCRFGGGIYITCCGSSKLLFNNCRITNNASEGNAGSFYSLTAGYTGSGGGIRADSSVFELRNTVLAHNSCKGGKGATNPTSGSPNYVPSGHSYGGSLAVSSGEARIYNCLFSENTARRMSAFGMPSGYGYGGAIYNDSTVLTIANCTFAKNTSEAEYFPYSTGPVLLKGAVLYSRTTPLPTLTNCIFWQSRNWPLELSKDTTAGIVGGGAVMYSLSWRALMAGTGNLSNTSPLFVDSANGDYRLSAVSPAINAGSNSAVPASLTTDLDGTVRIQQSTVDMGAYEAPASGLVGPATICSGAQAIFNGYPAGGLFSATNPAVITISQTGLVTGISAGTDTITYVSGTTTLRQVITVLQSPVIASISGNAVPVCPGTTLALSHALSGGSWSSANTSVATVTNAGVVAGISAGSALIKYTVVVSPGNGCPATASTSVTVLAAPVISGTVSNPSICVGSVVPLSGSAPGSTLSWSSSNTAVATVNTTGVVTGISTGMATITVTATGTNGCTKSFPYNLTVMSFPSVSPIAGPSAMCMGDSIVLNGSPAGGIWTSSNPSVASVMPGGAVWGISAGTATIKYKKSTSTCSDSTQKMVTVNGLPTPTLLNTNGILSTNTAATYEWFLNGIPIFGATGQTLLPTQSGDYSVRVSNATGCFGTSAPVTITAMGIADPERSGATRVYPNPATDIVCIDAAVEPSVIITTLDGRVVLQQENARKLSVAHLPADLYIVTIRGKNGEVLLREKLVKLSP
ncbi:MAG: T9SS type A sorting domain-containing protein [Sphingobacteriales bacterium]|nr:MAG: T9SS type A sorting domain-containing protein [Sphingobacteriales bacterium]